MIVNLNTYTDADFARNFIYKTDDDVAIDITNSTLRMMIRARADDATVFCDLSSSDGGGITILDTPTGAFYIYISRDTLKNLPVGTYVHSLIRRDSYGKRIEMWRGTLTHAAGPTRWED